MGTFQKKAHTTLLKKKSTGMTKIDTKKKMTFSEKQDTF